MKFLHTADIHLGSALPGFRRRSPGNLPENSDVLRMAFSNLVDLAIAENVAFVVIAGDLYDGPWADVSVGLFFAREMARLGRPCVLLRGNHDAESVVSSALPLPANVRLFGTARCETVELDAAGVALHGHSFAQREAKDDLSAHYCPPTPGMLNIGVLHTCAGGGEHVTYAPCTVDGLRGQGYGYWALGHVHTRRTLHQEPWIVFPGNVQGRHAKEIGAKGCSLVTVEDRRVVAVEHRDLDVLRWAAIEVDATGASLDCLQRKLEDALHAAFAEAGDRALAARVRLSGTSALHARLADDTERWADEVQALAANAGRQLWLESLHVATRPEPGEAPAHAALGRRFLGALANEADALLQEFTKLRRDLPSIEARDLAALPQDPAALALLAEDAWAMVRERMAAEAAG